jgi:hypothetical protein
MKILVPSLVLMAGLLVGSAPAAVIYYESFSVNTANNNPFPINGWFLHGAAGGVALSNGGDPNGANNQAAGINDNRTFNINAGAADATNDAQTGRYFYVPNGQNNGILWTNEYTVAAGSFTVDNIRWWDRSDAAPNFINRAAVQVGGNWFVSSSGATATGAVTINAGDGTWTQIGVDFATAQWLPITFTPGTALTQTISGTPQSLPAGDITAFGVYHQIQIVTAGLARVDAFEINATPVPEPSTFVLSGMALLGLAGKGWRRWSLVK